MYTVDQQPTAAALHTLGAHVHPSPLPLLTQTESSSRGQFVKNVFGGGALGLAALLSPLATRRAVAAAKGLDELAADIMIAKV